MPVLHISPGCGWPVGHGAWQCHDPWKQLQLPLAYEHWSPPIPMQLCPSVGGNAGQVWQFHAPCWQRHSVEPYVHTLPPPGPPMVMHASPLVGCAVGHMWQFHWPKAQSHWVLP